MTDVQLHPMLKGELVKPPSADGKNYNIQSLKRFLGLVDNPLGGEQDLKIVQQINYTTSNTTATLSARKGNAQPWRFFYVCSRLCG